MVVFRAIQDVEDEEGIVLVHSCLMLLLFRLRNLGFASNLLRLELLFTVTDALALLLGLRLSAT